MASSIPDWRDVERYRTLLGADLATWAWEFGRRASDAEGGPDGLCFAGPGPAADPNPVAIWRAEVDPATPTLTATPAARPDADALDLSAIDLPVLVVRCATGRQHVLVCDGGRRLRFAIVEGDGLLGPTRLSLSLPPRGAGAASLESLKALLHLRDTGRLPGALGAGNGARALRWVDALRAHDARRAGASQRDIAVLLYGARRVAADWCGASDYMRMRVQRLVRGAEAMVAGRYRTLFGLTRATVQADPPVEIWTSRRWGEAGPADPRGSTRSDVREIPDRLRADAESRS